VVSISNSLQVIKFYRTRGALKFEKISSLNMERDIFGTWDILSLNMNKNTL
jgi:hypothetical protein